MIISKCRPELSTGIAHGLRNTFDPGATSVLPETLDEDARLLRERSVQVGRNSLTPGANVGLGVPLLEHSVDLGKASFGIQSRTL
jgi:hypothetical protein